MNAIGIDYQRSAVVACVREETRSVPVGDGWRVRIPTAFAGDNLWGTPALTAEPHQWGGSDPGGPWPTLTGVEQFWSGLRDRLIRFLGRTEPSVRNGYQCFVTGERLFDSTHISATKSLMAKAGFDSPVMVSAVDALCSRWLIDETHLNSGETTAVFIAIGDSVAEVAARVIRFDAWGVPTFSPKAQPRVIEGVGHAWIQARLLRAIDQQLKEPLGATDAPILHDAIIEFAQLLRRTPIDESVEWLGPFRDRMFSSMSFTGSEIRSWPESERLAKGLPAAVVAALKDIGRPRAECIVIGGSGAAWPFAVETVGALAPRIWTSGDPTNDFAFGAAWYSLHSNFTGAAPEPVTSATPQLPDLPPLPATAATIDDDLPPWLRRGGE
jgi:hypothetical protein